MTTTSTQPENVIDYLAAMDFVRHDGTEMYDSGNVRVAWTDEGDGEGWWHILHFTGRPGWSCLEGEVKFSIGTPNRIIVATLAAVLDLQDD